MPDFGTTQIQIPIQIQTMSSDDASSDSDFHSQDDQSSVMSLLQGSSNDVQATAALSQDNNNDVEGLTSFLQQYITTSASMERSA